MTHGSYIVNHTNPFFPREVGLIDPRPAGTAGNKGFTLVELIVVMAILGVLATMSIPAYNNYINKAKDARAIADIGILSNEISAFYLDRGTKLNDLRDINRGSFKDPWNNDYVYADVPSSATPLKDVLDSSPLNTDYDLYSKGSDGESFTTGGDHANLDDIARSNDGNFVGLRP